MHSREIAFLALCTVHKTEGAFLHHYIPPEDHLAREIAYGTERRILTLDYIAQKLAKKGTLNLKSKERWLLRMAIYQHLFMDRIPVHALVNETVKLAKAHCHSIFVRFLNAALHRLVSTNWTLPQEDLAVRFSFPELFVQKLVKEYGLEVTREILQALNVPPPLMARRRFTEELKVVEASELSSIAQDPNYYLQSVTQAKLIADLAGGIRTAPKRVLDLCAAPGGKLIAVHEYFPQAELFANDSSEKRLVKLRENLAKYGVSANISCYPAENFPEGERFDLILLDVPCSNSGVLHKRPEARWRITEEQLANLCATQWACLQKAKQLLNPGGEIWYTSCSILSCENEDQIERSKRELNLTARSFCKHLPPNEGGFACALSI